MLFISFLLACKSLEYNKVAFLRHRSAFTKNVYSVKMNTTEQVKRNNCTSNRDSKDLHPSKDIPVFQSRHSCLSSSAPSPELKWPSCTVSKFLAAWREDLVASVGSQSRVDRSVRTFSLPSRTEKKCSPRDVARAFRGANVVPAALLESAFYRRWNAARPDDSKKFRATILESIAIGSFRESSVRARKEAGN